MFLTLIIYWGPLPKYIDGTYYVSWLKTICLLYTVKRCRPYRGKIDEVGLKIIPCNAWYSYAHGSEQRCRRRSFYLGRWNSCMYAWKCTPDIRIAFVLDRCGHAPWMHVKVGPGRCMQSSPCRHCNKSKTAGANQNYQQVSQYVWQLPQDQIYTNFHLLR